VVIAVPIGALVGHTGRGGFLIVGLANWLRSLPDFGLLILLVLLAGVHLIPVMIALLVLAIPPLLAGTYAGVSNVDNAVVDAARGVGMREREVLLQVELPNSLPLLLGGLRAATLQVIATVEMAAGAILVAVLALVVEGVLAAVQHAVVSPGLRVANTRTRPPTDPKNEPPRAAAPDRPTPDMAGVT
jgi:osmoprotectant transport system permease protein